MEKLIFMFCTGCEQERAQKDFMLDHDVCFRCKYREKIKVCGGSRKRCKICNSFIPKGRTSYCSQICYDKGMEEYKLLKAGGRFEIEFKKYKKENAHLFNKKLKVS